RGGPARVPRLTPFNFPPWPRPAPQRPPGPTGRAPSAPILAPLTRRQAPPFQCSTSDTAGYPSPPTAHTSFVARAATAPSWLVSAGPAGLGVRLRVQAVPSQW